jgi:23S rRNA pseudouridine2605 synthase
LKKQTGNRGRKSPPKTSASTRQKQLEIEAEGIVRLNKYIAHAGICSRREADNLITSGRVKVNGKVVTEMGQKIKTSERVEVDGHVIRPEEHVYILLYKPKDTITTTSDERDRSTVMDLIEDATGKRVYPVGRLDRNTTGLLLLTNDGELANRLMHPSYNVRKIYEVVTTSRLSDEDMARMKAGVDLEDGPAKAYHVSRMETHPNGIKLSVFEGRNHLVRRMIQAVGSEVVTLKRTIYGGLSLKGMRRGRWRFLKDREVNELRTLVKLLDKKSLKK